FGLDPAVPGLGVLARQVHADDAAPGPGDQPVECRAGEEAVAGAVAVVVGPEDQAGQGVHDEADLAEAVAGGEAHDGVPRSRPELDVLVGKPEAAECERVGLGAPDRNRDACARGHGPATDTARAVDEQPWIAGTAEGLVAV